MEVKEIDEAIWRLTKHLEKDGKAVAWAIKQREGGDDESKALEKDRWNLTNQVLKPWAKSGKEAPCYLAGLVRATLPFDRANALVVMQIVRGEECPRGFLWVSEPDLALLETKPSFGETTQCHSIANAYLAAARALEGDDADYVREMTAPMAPQWIVDKFGVSYPTLGPAPAPAAESSAETGTETVDQD